jgi:hypothetical protein
MDKKSLSWTTRDLAAKFANISFPEYQREPNIWSRSAKQRLVDSILRNFDIASLYLYSNADGSYDCIDGQQRIGAIMSFFGKNPGDIADDGFEVKILNEVFDDVTPQFIDLEGKRLVDIRELAAKHDPLATLAAKLVAKFEAYQVTVVELSNVERAEEFNLQFTRLNLGTIINSGEKLHAMFGDMREACFGRIAQHPVLQETSIPTRRFSREQLATQIVAQLFAFKENKEYTRTRHFDLQRFFKDYVVLGKVELSWIDDLTKSLDSLAPFLDSGQVLRNRAITVSIVLLANKLSIDKSNARQFVEFVNEFTCRLKWQIKKGVDIDVEYRYLLEFQRHVTQASVEKSAVQFRAATLEREYTGWLKSHQITGDVAFTTRTSTDPSVECRILV